MIQIIISPEIVTKNTSVSSEGHSSNITKMIKEGKLTPTQKEYLESLVKKGLRIDVSDRGTLDLVLG
jgi:type IV secretory pathway ATPase VirB11/archaellum biosynthesis ATPase